MRCKTCEELERRIAALEAERNEYKDKLLRQLAKMENLKHAVVRIVKEKS